jgi:hypothetical protein
MPGQERVRYAYLIVIVHGQGVVMAHGGGLIGFIKETQMLPVGHGTTGPERFYVDANSELSFKKSPSDLPVFFGGNEWASGETSQASKVAGGTLLSFCGTQRFFSGTYTTENVRLVVHARSATYKRDGV